MKSNFFQESLFRMGALEPVDIPSKKVVEAYVVLESDTNPEETSLANQMQLALDLSFRNEHEKDSYYHGHYPKKEEEDKAL